MGFVDDDAVELAVCSDLGEHAAEVVLLAELGGDCRASAGLLAVVRKSRAAHTVEKTASRMPSSQIRQDPGAVHGMGVAVQNIRIYTLRGHRSILVVL